MTPPVIVGLAAKPLLPGVGPWLLLPLHLASQRVDQLVSEAKRVRVSSKWSVVVTVVRMYTSRRRLPSPQLRGAFAISIQAIYRHGIFIDKLYVATLQLKYHIPFCAFPLRFPVAICNTQSLPCVNQPLGYHRTQPIHPDKSAFPLLFLFISSLNCLDTS